MGLLQRLFIRLGFILVLALAARMIGGAFSPPHPENETAMVPMTDRFGETHLVSAEAVETSALAAPLSEPEMHTALLIVRNRQGGMLGTGSGARMTYASTEGLVTLTPGEVAAINAEYRRFRAAIARAGDEAP